MSGSKENCSVIVLRKILKQKWPGYTVVGNQPDFTETTIFKIQEDGKWDPRHTFDSNHKCFKALLDPSFHPDYPYPKKGLFPELLIERSALPYLGKLIGLLKSANELAPMVGIDLSEQIETVQRIYEKYII